MHEYIQVHIHTYTCMHIVYEYTYIHVCICKYFIYTYIDAYSYIHTCISINIHIFLHAYIHKYTGICVYTSHSKSAKSSMQAAAMCCSVLQCPAVCCSVLQSVSACFSVLLCAIVWTACNPIQFKRTSFQANHTKKSQTQERSRNDVTKKW